MIGSLRSTITIIEDHTEFIKNENEYSVLSAFIPLCSFQEALQLNLFPLTSKSMKKYVADLATSVIVQNNEECRRFFEFEQTRSSIVNFSSRSSVLSKTFQQRFRHNTDMQKTAASVIHFALLC